MTTENNPARKNGLTYAEAGVDIDAGNLMVDNLIAHFDGKPLLTPIL